MMHSFTSGEAKKKKRLRRKSGLVLAEKGLGP
jgi:hypothetical protein